MANESNGENTVNTDRPALQIRRVLKAENDNLLVEEAGGDDHIVEDDNRAVPIEGDNRAVPIEGDNRAVPIEGDNRAVPVEGDGNVAQAEVGRSTGLEAYMKRKSDGKAILKAFKDSAAKKIPVKNTIRSKLVRLVITREKNAVLRNITEDQALEKFVITAQRFQILANEIATIFKGENPAAYFTAFTKCGDQSVLANGKLWHHYNYTKLCLRNDQLLRQKASSKPRHTLTDDELEPISGHEDILWLKNHLEPLNELIVKWKTSFDKRMILLTQGNISIYDYIKTFPCLSTQRAKDLFAIDFELLHPGKKLIDTEQWKKIKTVLISRLDDATVKDFDDSVLIGLLKTGELNAEKEDFIVLYLLCHVIKPKRNGKRKKRNQSQNEQPVKISLQERRKPL